MKARKLMLPIVLMLSTLMVAYAPMASFSHAQAADNKLQEMKTKAVDELQRRIDSYKKTLNSMDTTMTVQQGKSSVSVTSDQGSASGEVTQFCDKDNAVTEKSPSPTIDGDLTFKMGKNGLEGKIALPCGFKDKTKQFLETVVGGLTGMIDKVKGTQSLTEMTTIGKNIDAQHKLNQLAQVQASVTQSVDSMTGVLENLKATYNGFQGQVTALKECASGSAPQANCSEFDLSNADIANQAQGQLDSLSNIITTISSVVASVIGLLMSLFSSFSGLLGGLGSLGSLGNLGGLGDLLGGGSGAGSLGSLTGSLGSVTGLLGSFSAITSQLDITNFMSGNALGSLSGLTDLIPA